MPSAIPSDTADNTLYTVEEVQDILRLTTRTIYNYLRTGALRGTKIGRVWRITADSVRQFATVGVGVQRRVRRRQGQAFKSMTASEILTGPLPADNGEEYLIKGLLNVGSWQLTYTARQTMAGLVQDLKDNKLSADAVGDMVFCFHQLPSGSASSADADAAGSGVGADA